MLILISSTDYIVDFHYCQGDLKSFNLFGKAKNCHEIADKVKSCKHHQKKNIDNKACVEDNKNCCNNKSVNFDSNNDNQFFNSDYLSLDFSSFAVIPKLLVFTNHEIVLEYKIPFEHYKPPLVQKDMRVLFESFLL